MEGVLSESQKQPPEEFYEKTVIKNLVIFRRKNLCWSLFSTQFDEVFRITNI